MAVFILCKRQKQLNIFNFQKRAIALKCAQSEIYFYVKELFKEILISNARTPNSNFTYSQKENWLYASVHLAYNFNFTHLWFQKHE